MWVPQCGTHTCGVHVGVHVCACATCTYVRTYIPIPCHACLCSGGVLRVYAQRYSVQVRSMEIMQTRTKSCKDKNPSSQTSYSSRMGCPSTNSHFSYTLTYQISTAVQQHIQVSHEVMGSVMSHEDLVPVLSHCSCHIAGIVTIPGGNES